MPRHSPAPRAWCAKLSSARTDRSPNRAMSVIVSLQSAKNHLVALEFTALFFAGPAGRRVECVQLNSSQALRIKFINY